MCPGEGRGPARQKEVWARLSPGNSPLKSADDAEDVAFLHDQQVLAVELDLGAGPFAEQDLVARLDVERSDGAVLAARAGADGDDLAFLGLLLGGVGDDDSAGRLFLGLQAADQYPVMERTKIHARHLFVIAAAGAIWAAAVPIENC